MQRRKVLLGWIAIGVPAFADKAVLDPSMQSICSTPRSDDRASSHADGSSLASPARRYDKLIPPFQACVQEAQNFIGYSQQQLAGGDRTLAAGLRSAMDTDAVCGMVLNLASLNSRFTPALARQSVLVMEAALATTQAHADRHAECLRFQLACQGALAAARALA